MLDFLSENGLYSLTIIIIIIYLFYHFCKNRKQNDIKIKKINYNDESDKSNFGTLNKSNLEDDVKMEYLEDDINTERNCKQRIKLPVNISGNHHCIIAGENQTVPYDTKSFLQPNIDHHLSTTMLNNNNNNERSNNPDFGNMTLKASKKKATRDFQKLQNDNDKLQTENDMLKQEKLQTENDMLKQEILRLSETIINLSKEKKDLETKIEKLNEKNKFQEENYINLQNSLREQPICETVQQTESNLTPLHFEEHNTI